MCEYHNHCKICTEIYLVTIVQGSSKTLIIEKICAELYLVTIVQGSSKTLIISTQDEKTLYKT